jgi:Lon-like ATP-dependent protease
MEMMSFGPTIRHPHSPDEKVNIPSVEKFWIFLLDALKNIPVKQHFAITGSVSVRGETLPVGGVSAKVEAAIDTGITHVIVPQSNLQDIVVDKDRLRKIKIIPVDNVIQVLEYILDWSNDKKTLAKIKKLAK